MSVSVHKEDDRLPTKEPFMGGEKEWLIQRGAFVHVEGGLYEGRSIYGGSLPIGWA